MHIHEAMTAVQADLCKTGVAKLGDNRQQGFKFRAWDDVQQALSPILAKHKMLVIPHVTSRQQSEHTSKSGTVQFKVILSGEIVFKSGVDGSEFRYGAVGEGMDTGDKATSKALTMMVKYALLHGLQIPLQGVDDADKDTPDESQAGEGEHAEVLREAAMQGTDALRAAWAKIPKGERSQYTAMIATLKQAAEVAEAANATAN